MRFFGQQYIKWTGDSKIRFTKSDESITVEKLVTLSVMLLFEIDESEQSQNCLKERNKPFWIFDLTFELMYISFTETLNIGTIPAPRVECNTRYFE